MLTTMDTENTITLLDRTLLSHIIATTGDEEELQTNSVIPRPKVVLFILFGCSTILESNVGGMVVRVEPCYHCQVNRSSRKLWYNTYFLKKCAHEHLNTESEKI